MKKLAYLLILFFYCHAANADQQLTNQINTFEAVEEQNKAAERDAA